MSFERRSGIAGHLSDAGGVYGLVLRLNSRAPPMSDPMPASRRAQDHPEVPSVAIIKAE
jgi:hypothetical protein